MKAVGVEKAARRLREAAAHARRLSELEGGLDVAAFEREWFHFLTAINSVHEILKTSARSNATSSQWIASIDKNVIRKDPLLKYLLHARGTDYHGLESGAEPDVQGADYLGYVENPPVRFTIRGEDGVERTQGGGAIKLAGNPASFSFSYKLVPVTDERHNVSFEPPLSHLGNPLENGKPSTVAKAALGYYSDLLSKATIRVSRT